MKIILCLVLCIAVASCNRPNPSQPSAELPKADTTSLASKAEEAAAKEIRYPDWQLEQYLDSIGKLSPAPLMEKVAFWADSIFQNRQSLNLRLSAADFAQLKKGCRTEKMDIKTAKRLFRHIKIDSIYYTEGYIPIAFLPFGKKKFAFDEFAVYFDNRPSWNNEVWFFKGDQMIAKHDIYYRYELEMNHYKDVDGRTVIYYKQNFTGGTDIWWYNFYFYKFYGNRLIPILNELENGNLHHSDTRGRWLKSFVTNTNPLAIKMVYHQVFEDSIDIPDVVNDSTVVEYTWDEQTKTLQGNYANSKISKAQILTYYLEENELLFINSHYPTLKSGLKDKYQRHAILNYLNHVKNHYEHPMDW